MYSILKKLGVRNYCTRQSEVFTPEEYKTHFEKVSESRDENSVEIQRKIRQRVTRQEDTEVEREANECLGREFTIEEVMEEWSKVNDGASGEDGIRISYIKYADEDTKRELAGKIIEMMNAPPNEWSEVNSTGIVVPLHKKGPKNDLNNYRGVCLLPMISRVVARILATRLREWAEKTKLMDDNQSGFRGGRSTADAAQVFMRLHEEQYKK